MWPSAEKSINLLVACNSFKGCMAADEVCEAVAGAVAQLPCCRNLRMLPIADGGDGTARVLAKALGGIMKEINTVDALGREIKANYALLPTGEAVIELASASGLALIEAGKRNPSLTSTQGTGRMIADAITSGCRQIMVCLGGSATNDAATGLLSALGFRFLDGDGKPVTPCGANLCQIASIDSEDLLPGVKETYFTLLCDVDNPFYGPQGAVAVYGPQKGADDAMVRTLDEGMKHFASILQAATGIDVQKIKGSGAAGGCAGAMMALLNGKMVPGAKAVLDRLRFDEAVAWADHVITGEGRMDSQTLHGKAPYAVLQAAKQAGVPVLAIAGRIDDAELLREAGFTQLAEISPRDLPAEEAIKPSVTSRNIKKTILE